MSLTSITRKAVDILAHDKMPVWMSLLVLFMGVIVTYEIAPYINAKFETSKLQSSYVLESLKALNQDTSNLHAEIGRINRKFSDKSKVPTDDLEIALQLVTKLQWRVVEYRVLFRGDDAKKRIDEYTSSLGQVRELLDLSKSLKNQEEINKSVQEWTQKTANLIYMIVKNSKINIINS